MKSKTVVTFLTVPIRLSVAERVQPKIYYPFRCLMRQNEKNMRRNEERKKPTERETIAVRPLTIAWQMNVYFFSFGSVCVATVGGSSWMHPFFTYLSKISSLRSRETETSKWRKIKLTRKNLWSLIRFLFPKDINSTIDSNRCASCLAVDSSPLAAKRNQCIFFFRSFYVNLF